MQAYTQSKIDLNCTIICYLLAKLMKKYSKNIVLCIAKLLYILVKTGNY